MSMKEFGFGAGDEALDSKGRRFKAKEGESYRMSLAWWPGLEEGKPNLDADSPRFVGCKRLYLEGVGYFVDNGPEFQRLVGGQAGKMYAGTIIIVWPLDSRGKLDPARFAAGDCKVYSWVMSADKYRVIQQNHNQFPLGQHDIMVSCTDTKFQKITVSPCRENLLRKLIEANKADTVLAAARELAPDMGTEIAHNLTIDQIREKLARAAGGGAPAFGGGAAFGGGGGGAASGGPAGAVSADFEQMLDLIK